MQADFLDAHTRHWDDAEILLQAQRWANADHLYGIAAECGLKKLMLVFGMPYDTVKDRPSDRMDQVHANGVWTRFQSYSNGHRAWYAYSASRQLSPPGGWGSDHPTLDLINKAPATRLYY